MCPTRGLSRQPGRGHSLAAETFPEQISSPLLGFHFFLKIATNKQMRKEGNALTESTSIFQQHGFKAQGIFSFKKYIYDKAYQMLL